MSPISVSYTQGHADQRHPETSSQELDTGERGLKWSHLGLQRALVTELPRADLSQVLSGRKEFLFCKFSSFFSQLAEASE